jgi:hypothetical protein
MISWFNMKQTSVAHSTAEAEYTTDCSANSEVVWLQMLLVGLFDLELEATSLELVAQRYFCIGGTQHAEVIEQSHFSLVTL